jgi:hypothetical protein
MCFCQHKNVLPDYNHDLESSQLYCTVVKAQIIFFNYYYFLIFCASRTLIGKYNKTESNTFFFIIIYF